jgi:cation transport ATPase
MEENKKIETKKENFILPIIIKSILIILAIYLKYLALTTHGEGVLILAPWAYVLGIFSVVFILSGFYNTIKFLIKKEQFYSKTLAIVNLILSFVLLFVLLFGIFYEDTKNNFQQKKVNDMIQKTQDDILKNKQDICLYPEKYPKNIYTQFCENYN